MQLKSFSNFSTTFSVSVTFLRCWPGNCLNINRGRVSKLPKECPMPIAQCPKLKILDSIMQKNQIDQFLPKYLFLSQKANEPKKAFLDEEFFGTETLVAWFAFFHLVTEQGHQIYTFPSLLSQFIRV